MSGLTQGGVGENAAVDTIQWNSNTGMALAEHVEKELSDEARTAIGLVNAAALELHPEAAEYGSWSGPLEWVNQSWTPTGEDADIWDDLHAGEGETLQDHVFEEVLAIYDRAISQRKACRVGSS